MCAPGLGFRRFRDLGLAPTPKTKKTGETRVFKPGESHGFKTCVLCVLKPGESHGLKTGDTHNFVTCLLVYLFCVFFVRDFCCFLGVFVLVAKVHHYLHKTYTHTHTNRFHTEDLLVTLTRTGCERGPCGGRDSLLFLIRSGTQRPDDRLRIDFFRSRRRSGRVFD